MPRFSAAFRRKSVVDNLENVDLNAPAQSSFRVLERNTPANARSFDGGAKLNMPRPANSLLKPMAQPPPPEENMFADFKTGRVSGLSHTTQATSTDNSSRHSNASTAPSSADLHGNNSPIEARHPSKVGQQDADSPARGTSTKSISASLFKAPRTWSFGGQKKHSVPPPRDEPPIPDLPPVLTIQAGSASISTEPTTSNNSLTSQETKALDLGGDFGAMFSAKPLDAVADTNANHRSQPGNRGGIMTSSASEPLLYSDSDGQTPTGVSRFPSEYKKSDYKKSTPSPVHDEDAKLLRDSFAAMSFLNRAHDGGQVSATEAFYNRQSRDDHVLRKPTTAIADSFTKGTDDNIFEGRAYSFAKSSQRYITPRTTHPERNKVMTPAQFEKYKLDKERQGMTQKTTGRPLPALPTQDDDEDDINYDDDEDEAEKSRQQVKQRRKQEAHMAVYRQQMMKVTGEHVSPTISQARPSLPASRSAPQLSFMKNMSPIPNGASDEDEDDEVPLAILQAHGFPAKNRPPNRLSMSASSTNLPNTQQPSASGGPSSVLGDISSNAGRRASTLPAFARGLPQDPFVGASIAKPAVRESMSFHDSNRNSSMLPPGGLVGVIANEERSRALRRGSPNTDVGRPLPPNMYQQSAPGGYDGVGGIPPQMMYGQPGMSAGEQAQQQMTNQMQQFMQMQMQFMQMMTINQHQQAQGMPMPNNPYSIQQQSGIPAAQSVGNLSRQSVMGMEQMMDRYEPNVRTMSMVQPPSVSLGGGFPGYAGSIHGSIGGNGGVGYAPSITPSERSNIGLPGRYRPVSQAANPPPRPSPQNNMPISMPGEESTKSNGHKSRISLNVAHKTSGSDDDEESGWAAMKAKRDKKRTLWRSKKPANDLTEQLAAI